jgi:ATP-dependent Zn protease
MVSHRHGPTQSRSVAHMKGRHAVAGTHGPQHPLATVFTVPAGQVGGSDSQAAERWSQFHMQQSRGRGASEGPAQ